MYIAIQADKKETIKPTLVTSWTANLLTFTVAWGSRDAYLQ